MKHPLIEFEEDEYGHVRHPTATESEGKKSRMDTDITAPDDRSGEALLHKCCADLGVNMGVAMSILQWADENVTRGEWRGVKDEGNNEAARMMAAFMKMLRYIVMHPTPIHVFAIVFAFGEEVPLLDHMIGYATPAGFAKTLRNPAGLPVSREAVNKVVLEVQAKFKLPERHGQRSAKARRNMKLARLGQLKPEAAIAEPDKD